jgi:threonine synthase
LKTAAYETAEQLGWDVPGWVVTPVGGGGLLVGLYLGFLELLEAGMIRQLPRLAAIQSAACDPIHRAWVSGDAEISAVSAVPTAAEGIAVAKPVRGKTILEAIWRIRGVVEVVEDDAIWKMVALLGRQGGIRGADSGRSARSARSPAGQRDDCAAGARSGDANRKRPEGNRQDCGALRLSGRSYAGLIENGSSILSTHGNRAARAEIAREI